MEQVVKGVRKDAGAQSANIGNGRKEPASWPQKKYIAILAKSAGLKVNLDSVEDKEKAAQLIDSLKLLNSRVNGNSIELRDKRIAFGLSTKLVFEKYVATQKGPMDWNKFWNDVERFYSQYLSRQEVAALGAAALPSSLLEQ